MDIATVQQQAAVYLAQGHYQKAIALYEQGVRIDPNSISNHWYLGLAWLLQGDTEQAQGIWISALAEEMPDNFDRWTAELLQILMMEAGKQLQAGKAHLAIRIYQQALELDATSIALHYALGVALAQEGRLDEAIAQWQHVVELNPDFAKAYQAQGEVLQKLEQFEAAIAVYARFIELQPNCAKGNYNLGLCLVRQGRLAEAIACFRHAAQLQPDCSAIYGDWAYVLWLQGNFDEAISRLAQVVQLRSDFFQTDCHWTDFLNVTLLQDIEIHLRLGNLLTSNGYVEPALATYQYLLQRQPDSSEIYSQLGYVLTLKQDFYGAISHYQQAVDSEPERAELYYGLGKALTKVGQVEQAIISYEKALDLKPNWGAVWSALGNRWSAMGEWDRAIACYQNTLKLEPKSVEAYFNLGIAFAYQGNSREAIACFHKTMELNSAIAKTVWDMIQMLCQQSRLSLDDENLQHILPVDPPGGFYPSALTWAIASHSENNYISIHPNSVVSLTPPKTLDESIHFSFRFGDLIELPNTFVVQVPKGRFWLDSDQARAAIIASDNHLLIDLSPESPILSPGHPDKASGNHGILMAEKLQPWKTIDGTIAVLSSLSNDMYFHWMCDVLPRLQLLQLGGIQWDGIDKFLVSNHLPFQQETLSLFGVPPSKILETSQNRHVHAENLIVPSFSGSIAWMSKAACDFIRDVFFRQINPNVREGFASPSSTRMFPIDMALPGLVCYLQGRPANFPGFWTA
jgi:tetratricopeptide (TPR) repeat protein